MRKEKKREAPKRPGSEDGMTEMDKVLRDPTVQPTTLFASRKGSATGGPACLGGFPPHAREPLGRPV